MKLSAELISKCLLRPLRLGITGYVLFFLVIIVTKYFSWMMGKSGNLEIGTEDFVISLVGFGLFFLIRLFENFQKPQTKIK